MIFDSKWRAIAKKSWTVRVNALAATAMAALAFLPFDPVTMLGVWNMMPASVQRIAPVRVVAVLGGVLFVLSILARLRPKRGAD